MVKEIIKFSLGHCLKWNEMIALRRQLYSQAQPQQGGDDVIEGEVKE